MGTWTIPCIFHWLKRSFSREGWACRIPEPGGAATTAEEQPWLQRSRKEHYLKKEKSKTFAAFLSVSWEEAHEQHTQVTKSTGSERRAQRKRMNEVILLLIAQARLTTLSVKRQRQWVNFRGDKFSLWATLSNTYSPTNKVGLMLLVSVLQ